MDADPDPVAGLLLKLRMRDEVSQREEEVLRTAVSEIRTFPAGRTIVRSGQELDRSMLLVEGLIARFKDLNDGQRQIMEIHVAGDFTDLHGFPLKRLDHDVGALTEVRMAFFPHSTLKQITEEQPHLARILWMSTLMDAAIQRERILSVGRRPARSRIAHLLCELQVRLEVIGLADSGGYALPLSPLDLGDATGLTSVHVNRMLRELREDGLLTFRGARVTIHDLQRLMQVAEFDPVYLHLEHRPR